MNLVSARNLAVTLMDEHGLTDWAFNWDSGKRRYGQCRFSVRTLSFSKILTELNDEATFRNVVLHEIAHALVGAGHGHDHVWKARARSIGCTGTRCTSVEVKPPSRWTISCQCGQVSDARHRRPKAGVYYLEAPCCGEYNPKFRKKVSVMKVTENRSAARAA